MSENGAWQILSTGVPITQRGASAAQPERKAQEQADALERLHNGSGSYKREQARLRAAAVAVIALGGVLKARLASRYAMRQDSEEYVFPAFAREYRNNTEASSLAPGSPHSCVRSASYNPLRKPNAATATTRAESRSIASVTRW